MGSTILVLWLTISFPSLTLVLQLRVDGVLMRLRDTRMHCIFSNSENPIILRESCWREATFQALAEVRVHWLLHAKVCLLC